MEESYKRAKATAGQDGFVMAKKNKKWKKEKAARRGVAIPREMAEALKRQEQRFIEKFGRPLDRTTPSSSIRPRGHPPAHC